MFTLILKPTPKDGALSYFLQTDRRLYLFYVIFPKIGIGKCSDTVTFKRSMLAKEGEVGVLQPSKSELEAIFKSGKKERE